MPTLGKRAALAFSLRFGLGLKRGARHYERTLVCTFARPFRPVCDVTETERIDDCAMQRRG